MRRFLKIGATLIGTLLLAATLFGFLYERIAERWELAQFPRQGRLVDVDGHSLYLYCAGEGSPTVVLDSALGGLSYSWGPIQSEVARFARVCSYDRAGYGLSEPGPTPRTSQQIASELYALLRNAGVLGPYVLVGHSLGGYDIRLFTMAHPAEVTGLVLVDAASENALERLPPALRPILLPNLSQMKLASFLSEFGLHRVALAFRKPRAQPGEAQRAGDLNLHRRAFLRAITDEMESLPQSGAQVKNAGSLGDRPVIVLTRGPVRAGEAPRQIPVRLYQDFERIWRDDLQASMVRLSTRGEQRFADHSGHMIPQDQPAAVVAAIRDVVERLR